MSADGTEKRDAEIPIRVLYVNHTGIVSGAEHSLLTLMAAVDSRHVVGLACPEGRLADEARGLGVRVHQIHGTSGSLRLHPWRTIIAAVELLRMVVEIRRITRASAATVLHANSLRSGLAAALVHRRWRGTLVVHLRDCLPRSRAAQAVGRIITRNADAIVPISHHVAAGFEGVTGDTSKRDRVHVVYNAVDLLRFRSNLGTDATSADSVPLVAIVGQITSWKGHDTIIRAMPDVRARCPGARLLVVGEVKFAESATRLDNRAFLHGLHELIARLGLGDAVDFLGERDDIPEIMAGVNAVLVPSVEEPFGRTVAEAMAVGTPVIATSVGGPTELIESGVTGLLVPPAQPSAWADAICRILLDREWAECMSRRASDAARSWFAPRRHVEAMMTVYQRVTYR